MASVAEALYNTLLVANNVEISGNAAASSGGGVWMNHANTRLNMSGGEISDNGFMELFDANNVLIGTVQTVNGGGVYVANGRFDLHNGAVSDNWARNGGGVGVGTNGHFHTRSNQALPGTAEISGNEVLGILDSTSNGNGGACSSRRVRQPMSALAAAQ